MKNGWQTKKIGDVCRLMTGGTPSKARPEYFGGEIRWLVSGDIHQREIFDCEGRITEAGMKNSNARLLPVNSVMIALNGQGKTRGTVALLRTRATCNQSLVSIYPNEPEKLLPEFLYANLHGRYQEIRHMTGDSGNDRRGLNMVLIKGIEIPIAPLPQQRRIVGILANALEGIATAKANAEKNLQNARALFESHLQSVFTQRGKGWGETTLEKILAVQPQNGWSPPAANHSDSGTPVLTLSSVTGFRFRPDKVKFTSASTDSRRNYWVKNGDFLITRSNTPELVGHVAIASGIDEPTIYPDLIMRMNPMPDRMTTEFLYYQMRSPSLRKEITSRAQGANPTMKKISNGAVKTLPIAIPAITTQRAIVKTLNGLCSETERLANLYGRKLAALDALKRSLLHQAFAGNL
jgi:type I restriction enzyme S subunit